MRRKDISYEFTNVNSKLIEEAAEYRPANKNLIRTLALAACLAILVTAIPLTLVMNRENKVQTPDFLQTQPSENNGGDDVVIDDTSAFKVIYCSSSIKEELIDKYKGQDVEIRDSAEIEISGEEKEVDPSTIEGIPARLYLTVEGKELICTFNGKVFESWDKSTKPSIYIAEYQIDDEEISSKYPYSYVRFNLYSQEVSKIFFYYLDTPTLKEHKIDKEIAKENSDKVVTDIYGEDVWDLYQFEEVEEEYFTKGDYKVVKGYKTVYRAYTNGYKTTQRILVYHDVDGTLSSVMVGSPTKIDILENLNPEDIKLAREVSEKEFEEVLKDGTLISAYINVQSDDKAYWCYTYRVWHALDELEDYEFFYPIG
jgi:hypothetical protein